MHYSLVYILLKPEQPMYEIHINVLFTFNFSCARLKGEPPHLLQTKHTQIHKCYYEFINTY